MPAVDFTPDGVIVANYLVVGLKAKMTPTAIAKLLKANGVNASVDGLRRHVKAVADGKKRARKPVAKSAGKPPEA